MSDVYVVYVDKCEMACTERNAVSTVERRLTGCCIGRLTPSSARNRGQLPASSAAERQR